MYYISSTQWDGGVQYFGKAKPLIGFSKWDLNTKYLYCFMDIKTAKYRLDPPMAS